MTEPDHSVIQIHASIFSIRNGRHVTYFRFADILEWPE